MNPAARFGIGRESGWSKSFILRFWFPVMACCFAAGVAASAYYFGRSFDWRYCTLSILSSQSSNPHGYVFCCLGLMVTFTMALPLCSYMRARLEPFAPRIALFSFRALTVGFLGAVIVGTERLFARSIPIHLYKLHEVISIVTFFGLLAGLAGFGICLTRKLLRQRQRSPWVLPLLSMVSVGPLVGCGLSQAYLYFVPSNLGWVGPHWAELGVPLYLSFAFWEWLSFAGIFSYLSLTLVCLPAEVPTKGK